MREHLLLSLTSLCVAATTNAQIAIGEWRDHFPYRQALAVTEGGGKAWCATRNAVFNYDPTSGELERLTKVNALSDVDISTVAFNGPLGVLVVGYRNGNMDLVSSGSASNLSDIKRSNIVGDKAIYDIEFQGPIAYLACGFGIVVVDLAQQEVRDTWYIAPGGTQQKVNAISFTADSIYAATNIGLFAAWRDAPNLAAFTSWNQRMDIPQPNGPFNGVGEIGGKLLVNYHRTDAADKDTVYYFENGNWQRLVNAFGHQNSFVSVSPDGPLLLCQGDRISSYTADLSSSIVFLNYGNGQIMSPNAAIPTANGTAIWVADKKYGLVRQVSDFNGTPVYPIGPATVSAQRIAMAAGGLYVATGGVASNWSNLFRQEGVHCFVNGTWSTMDKSTDPLMQTGGNPFGQTVNDIMAVAVDPEDGAHAFAGSWDDGVIEIRNGHVETFYNASGNSSLQIYAQNGAENQVMVAGLAFDPDGNLWVANSNCEEPISVRTNSGSWRSFDPGNVLNNNSLLGDVLAARNNSLKWFIRPRSNGLLVFDDNGTIDQVGDDQYKALTTAEGNGALPSLDVFSLAEDLDGEIWVGTGKGVAVFYNPGSIFSSEGADSQQILIEQDGNVQILLETEAVISMAVDGADHKWLGTQSSGAYLVSADGTEQLIHFTPENSPLPSNTVTGIAIDERTGEVFFSTDQGIVSYRNTATEGGTANDCASVFPNPVRETWTGPIAITGLMRDSDVKVTDIAGNLVFRTTSEGGQAIWPGTDLSGNRVSTGVYMVFVADPTGTSRCNTKVLVVR